MFVFVHLCVFVRERESDYSLCVYTYVCVRERLLIVCVYVCVFVCVWEREYLLLPPYESP